MTAVLALGACSLDENLRSTSESDGFYNSTSRCRTGINACYNLLRTIFSGQSVWLMTDAQTDCMILNSSTNYVATLNISPTRPAIASTIWKYGYQGVMRANAMLYSVEKCREDGGCSESEAVEMSAELVAVRAMFYYLLTSTFGDVPFYTEPVDENNRAGIASLPRMSADATRDYLIDELLHWFLPESEGGLQALPLKRSYDPPFENRLNAPAGLMLAAKMCLWNHRWEDAVKALEVLEDIYGDYTSSPETFGTGYPLSDIPFSRKYTPESILEFGNVFEEYGNQATGYIAVVATPSKSSAVSEGDDGEYSISDVYAGIGIPEMGTRARISVSCRPTTWFFQTVLSYDSPDLRSGEYSAGASEARGGSGTLAWRWKGYERDDAVRAPEDYVVRWFRTGSSQTASSLTAVQRPWLGNKFWCPGMYYTMDSNNPKFFRYADALLMMSEAWLNLGDYEKAAAYLNITRVRAGLEKLSLASVGGNAEAFMEEIRMERARELFGEFQRKFDLVRWGIWYERTSAYNDGTYLKDFIRPCHRYMPIPAEQITYSGGALDNNEYGAD